VPRSHRITDRLFLLPTSSLPARFYGLHTLNRRDPADSLVSSAIIPATNA